MRGDFVSQFGITAEEMGQPRDIEEDAGRLLGFFQPDDRTELIAGFGQCFQRRAVGRRIVGFDRKRFRIGWRLICLITGVCAVNGLLMRGFGQWRGLAVPAGGPASFGAEQSAFTERLAS